MSTEPKTHRTRRLIEEWLPIAELSEESIRERRSMTALPPTYYLHVWFARRPLVASRAAILASLLRSNADRSAFLHNLGIHGDPVAARTRIAQATAAGIRLGAEAYGYRRAFTYSPESGSLGLFANQTVLDPTAGGGSVPIEGIRLGLMTIANDLNPVAALIIKASVEFPARFGRELLELYQRIAKDFKERTCLRIRHLYPEEPSGYTCDGYLWVRTVVCPYCGGKVPLSPNWRLSAGGTGVRLQPLVTEVARTIKFEVVANSVEQSAGTVKDGTGLCPYPDCKRTIEDSEIKEQARNGTMGHELYAVVYRRPVQYTSPRGKQRVKYERGFRSPRPEDNIDSQVRRLLEARSTEWSARNILPDEEIDQISNYDRGHRLYGIKRWSEMFTARQLFTQCTVVEVFQDIVAELIAKNGSKLPELERAALTYLGIAIDKLADYNSMGLSWHSGRGVLEHTLRMHNFSYKWSFAEMAATVPEAGIDWATRQTGKALKELIALVRLNEEDNLFSEAQVPSLPTVLNSSADSLPLANASIDCVVMDPPYYDNVMYAELADFFYVWLKRTAGLLYPELFMSYLTDKDREAVANPAKFAGQKGGAKNLAGRDYQRRMAAIFKEQKRLLKPDGIMTVMFTHKANSAWDALATGLIEAGFVITASWPVHTEAEGSLHIREKAAAKSTIFLVCRVRENDTDRDEPRYWEEVEPLVAAKVREKVKSFQDSGLAGVDLYLACFGPALEVFSNEWPLTRGRARVESFTQARRRKKQAQLFQEEENPYAVRPEDALEAARREVKNWRLTQLATVSRQHHLDPLTEWYMLAWDTFRAPKFDADEALKLARVIGLDFDQQVRNIVCDLKTDQVTLWDSRTRHEKGKLGHVGDEIMIDTLHWAALTVRDQNTGAAKSMLERANLIDDPTLKTALEAILKVLPQRASGAALAGFASDFEALEKLRHLAFEGDVPPPPEQIGLEFTGDASGEDE